jgi:hypothetical protein
MVGPINKLNLEFERSNHGNLFNYWGKSWDWPGILSANTSQGRNGDRRLLKVLLCMAGKSLSHDLKPQGIAVAILHPGLLQTRMTGFSGITTETAGLLARIDGLTLGNTGINRF